MTNPDTLSGRPQEASSAGAADPTHVHAAGSLQLQAAPDLDRWHMVLGYTVENLNAELAAQAREFLSQGDPDRIPVSVPDPEGTLRLELGLPRLSLLLSAGACMVLSLHAPTLNGRDITNGAKDLRLGFRLDLAVEPYTFDQILEHPFAGDEIKFALSKLLEAGEVTRESHGLACLRCRLTSLDLKAALQPSETQLAGITEPDRTRLLALLERWLRTLDDAHNPFFFATAILARHAPEGPWLDTEPTLASFAYLFNGLDGPKKTQLALLLNCGGVPAPEGHVPGRFVMTLFRPPNMQEPYQGSLCVLSRLLITDHLLARIRTALQMPSAPAGPGFTLSDVRVRQAVHRVNPYGIAFNDCLRTTDTRNVSVHASDGVDPGIGRYAAVDVRVDYNRRMLARKYTEGMNNDQTVFTDSDFNDEFPFDGLLHVTVRFRFTVVERRFVVDRTLDVQWKPAPATTDLIGRMRSYGGGHAAMADLYERELRQYDSDLAMLSMLKFNLLPERCLLPSRTLLSFRDPQGHTYSTFDRPWALYFSLTRNA